MCGIAGFIASGDEKDFSAYAKRILKTLAHRGPDDRGWMAFSAEGVRTGSENPDPRPARAMLLHRRLSILDLSPLGHQPMASADGRYHIVFNGEIYNYLELREQLKALGHVFRTGTDTEVLIAALAEWGLDALKRLTGMFAFGLLDVRRRELLLARDFFSIKPLFYCCYRDGFAFASELKALRDLPGAPQQVNPTALYHYLVQGTVETSDRTFYDQIYRLLPGHYLRIALDDPTPGRQHPYWTLEIPPPSKLSFAQATERVRAMFLENVRLHLRSDVPVGVALSGGIDSTAIIMAMRALAGPRQEIHSFSFIAPGSHYDEEKWIDIAAEAAGSVTHKIQIQSQDLLDDFDAFINAQDEPFGSTSIYAQFRVFRRVQEAGIKVMLDGQGGDEIFAGYPIYALNRLLNLLQKNRYVQAAFFVHHSLKTRFLTFRDIARTSAKKVVPEQVIHYLRPWLKTNPLPIWLNKRWFSDRGAEIQSKIITPKFSSLQEMLVYSLQYSALPALLRFEDRNSMAHSVESRVPFLTPQFVEFVLSLPEDYLLGRDGTSKNVFRAAMRGLVPDAILDRKDKIGFRTPEENWFKQQFPFFDRIIQSDAARSITALDYPNVVQQVNKIQSGNGSAEYLWRFTNLIRWTENNGGTYE